MGCQYRKLTFWSATDCKCSSGPHNCQSVCMPSRMSSQRETGTPKDTPLRGSPLGRQCRTIHNLASWLCYLGLLFKCFPGSKRSLSTLNSRQLTIERFQIFVIQTFFSHFCYLNEHSHKYTEVWTLLVLNVLKLALLDSRGKITLTDTFYQNQSKRVQCVIPSSSRPINIYKPWYIFSIY